MGLREKVTITLVIIALIQIACRHCMPRTPGKASLKRYLNDLKPVKNNPTPTPYSPTRLNKAQKQTFGKTAQNGKISQNSLPKKSLYETYKFPEMEFPLDNSPRDPFHIGMNFKDNSHVSTLQKARNLQSIAIKDLKKEMKMKRKLLSNKQMNSEISPLKTDMSSIKITSNPASMFLLDSESFPEVQYPLNTMETWGQNYRSYIPFTQEKQFGFGQQTLNRQPKEDINKPFTKLTKAKASKYLQSYDKLKEEHRRTSTQNSKRSNAGQKGLNFTKTATCEKTSDDFMTAGLISNIANNSTEIKRTLESSMEIKPSPENTCPVTEFPNHSVPIPYRGIENNTENKCAFEKKKVTKELQDVDTSVIAQTLQLIEEILLHDDTSSATPTDNYSQNIENNVDSSKSTDVPARENIPTTLMDTAKNYTDSPAEEISQEVPDDAASGILQDEMPSVPEEILADNATAIESPLSVRMPLSLSIPIEFEAVTNGSERGPVNTAVSNAVPGSTSIIIIPIGDNSDGKSLSHILETTTGTPIIVYLPSTQNSGIPSQAQNHIVSSLLENSVPNNEQSNVLSNMAPLQNENPSSTALVSELLNSILDSGSSLPMHETLPNNSMCDNNENSPSSMKEKPISDILIDKSLTDDVLLTTINCDGKLLEQPTETYDCDMNTDTLPPTPDFKHPLFDFAGSEFSSLSHGPYNNILINELPILAREINSDQQYSNSSSEALCIPTLNVTLEHLHKNISQDASPEIASEIATVVLNLNYSNSDSQQQSIMIDEIPSSLFDATVEEQLPKRTPLLLNPNSETISDYLSEIVGMNIPPTSSATTDNTSSIPDPVFDEAPILTDMSIKSELYNIRQILEKMLSSQIPTGSQTHPSNAIIPPTSKTDSLPMLVNETLEPTQTLTDSVSVPVVEETDTIIDSLPLQEHEKLPYIPVDRSSLDTPHLPVDQPLIPSLLLDTADKSPLLIDETVLPKSVFENPADNKPYLLDNLVTPLSETHTKDTLENGLSRTIDEVPSKIGFVIPSIHEIPSDEPPLPVVNLPVMVHQEDVTNPKSEVLQNILPIQMFEPQSSLSDLSVSGLRYLEKTLSTQKVSQAFLPDVSPEIYTTTMSSYSNADKMQHSFSPPIVHSSGDEKVQKVDLPLSIIPAQSLSDASTNLPDDSPSPINAKIGEFAHARTDTKDLPLVKDPLLSIASEDYTTPDTLITHIPTAGPLSTNPDKATDTVHLHPIFSNLPHHDILSTEDKMLPTTENTPTDLSLTINKIPSSSKLSIAMALLENVLIEMSKEGLSSTETKSFPATPLNLDKTEYQVEVVSPPSEAEDIYPKSEALPNPESPLNILSLPVDKEPSITPNLGIPSKELSFEMNETPSGKPLTSVDIQTDDIGTQKGTEILDKLDVILPSENFSLSLNTLDRTSQSNKNTVSASKLPITKALLENILSDITRGFSLPAASKALPVKSSSVLDKTMPYTESPLSAINEERPSSVDDIISSTKVAPTLLDEPNDPNLPHAEKFEENLPLGGDKSLSEMSSYYTTMSSVDISSPNYENVHTDTPSDLLNNKTIRSSKLPITKALLKNVLSDVTSKSFSLPVSKLLPVKSSSALDKTLYYAESPLSDITDESPTMKPSVNEMIPNTTYSDQPTEDNRPFSEQFQDTMPLEAEKSLSEVLNLDIPSEMSSLRHQSDVNILSLKTEILPKDTPSDLPLSNTKTFSSSKLPIAKALLENVLSDVTSKNFTLPVSQVLPVKSSSALDKTLYYAESPLPDITDESPSEKLSVNEVIPNTTYSDQPAEDNRPFSEQFKDTMPLEAEKSLSEVLNLDIPSEMPSLRHQSDVNILPLNTEILPKDTPSDLPLSNTKAFSSSKLPITKALLENVLSDVTSKNFSLPVSQVLPVKSSSALDKTLYYAESPLPDITDESTTEKPSVNEMIPNTTYSDQPTEDNSPFYKQFEDTMPLEAEKSLSEVLNLDIPSEMSSLKHQSDVNILPLKTEILLKDTPSDLPLSNTKTFSSSKLPITKALLENVLYDVTSKNFSLPVSQVLPVKSSSALDKTLYYKESPLPDITDENPTEKPSVNEMIPNTTYSDQPTEDNSPFYEQFEDTIPEEEISLSEVSNFDILSGKSSLMDKTNDEMSSPKIGILPEETLNDQPLSNTKTLASSKLSITKALLQNVLSDVTSKNFSLPVSIVLPVKSSSVLDKTHSSESPLSDFTEEVQSPSDIPSVNENLYSTPLSDQPTDNNLPFYGQPEDTLSTEVDKTLSEVSNLDIHSEMSSSLTDKIADVDITLLNPEIISKDSPNEQLIPNNKSLISSKLPIIKAPLENVLPDGTTNDFSLPVSKVPHVKSSSVLDKTHYLESPLSDLTEEDPIPMVSKNYTLSEETSMDILLKMQSFMDNILPKSNVDTISPTAEVLPKQTPNELPPSNTKMIPSSKLSITKALLENVLSDINTKGFSVPVPKSSPIASRKRLDKTLYYMDSSLSDSNEESLDDDFRFSDINADDDELSLEKIFTDNPNLDLPVNDFPIDQISKDESDDLTEEIEGEDSNETFSDNPMDDMYDLPTQVDKPLSLSDNMSNDLPMPQNNRIFASRIPITKALLEKVLSDINDGSIRP